VSATPALLLLLMLLLLLLAGKAGCQENTPCWRPTHLLRYRYTATSSPATRVTSAASDFSSCRSGDWPKGLPWLKPVASRRTLPRGAANDEAMPLGPCNSKQPQQLREKLHRSTFRKLNHQETVSAGNLPVPP